MVEIAASILNADFANLGEAVRRCEDAGADLLHLDVMDGSFVKPITFGAQLVEAIRKRTGLRIDVHLMVMHPDKHVDSFIDAGADIITVHTEASEDLKALLCHIRERGALASASINPLTPVDTLINVLGEMDMALIMSVNPGLGGQRYMPMVTDKIRQLRAEANLRSIPLDIEVDGGIRPETIGVAADAGANVFVVGSILFSVPNMAAEIQRLKVAAKKSENYS